MRTLKIKCARLRPIDLPQPGRTLRVGITATRAFCQDQNRPRITDWVQILLRTSPDSTGTRSRIADWVQILGLNRTGATGIKPESPTGGEIPAPKKGWCQRMLLF